MVREGLLLFLVGTKVNVRVTSHDSTGNEIFSEINIYVNP